MRKPNTETIRIAKNALELALGQGRVLDDKHILEKYAVDETSDLMALPDLVFMPLNTDEVCAALRVCNEFDFPVTPRGAGSGVTGGALATTGGLVISMEKMDRIIEIDAENMTAVVEPGAITADVQNAALKEGLLYPPDPASLDRSSIGGNVSENAGGMTAVKYGTTKDYLLGLECVLANGELIRIGGKTVKNVMGYNISGLIAGSEGTLAVITKLYLRLIPQPVASLDMLIPFSSLNNAIDAVYKILKSRIIPTTLEFMEADAIALTRDHLKTEMPFPDAEAHLLVRLDGSSADILHRDVDKILNTLELTQTNIRLAESDQQKEAIWKARRSIRDSIQKKSPVFLAEDCSVPRSKIPEFLKSLKEYLSSEGLRSIMFGHAGDGNVHIDVLKGDMDYKVWQEMLPGLKSEIYRRAINLGGSITGEHGIGYLRKNYIPLAMSKEEIELHRQIKKAFDPKGILNPGKLIPEKEPS